MTVESSLSKCSGSPPACEHGGAHLRVPGVVGLGVQPVAEGDGLARAVRHPAARPGRRGVADPEPEHGGLVQARRLQRPQPGGQRGQLGPALQLEQPPALLATRGSRGRLGTFTTHPSNSWYIYHPHSTHLIHVHVRQQLVAASLELAPARVARTRGVAGTRVAAHAPVAAVLHVVPRVGLHPGAAPLLALRVARRGAAGVCHTLQLCFCHVNINNIIIVIFYLRLETKVHTKGRNHGEGPY